MITRKNEAERDAMRRAGKVIARLLEAIEGEVKVGVTTGQLDQFAESFIRKAGAKPAFKGYYKYPSTICASVNEEVVHGMPGKRKLADGDIIGIDVGAIVDGFYSDAARTFPVGKIDAEKKKLITVAKEALQRGIDAAGVGQRVSDMSHAIERAIKPHGFGIVYQYVGHGIGTNLHEEPQIPNYGEPGQGPKIMAGMAFALEPMVNAGTADTEILADGWTVVTKDKRPSAHFENTILITETGVEVLTV